MLLINRCAQYGEGGGKDLCLFFFSLKISNSWFFWVFFITDYFNVLEILEISLCTKTLEKDIDEHRRRSPLGNEVSRRVLCLVTNFPWFHTWRWISTETCNPNWTDPSHLFKLFIVQSVISLNSWECLLLDKYIKLWFNILKTWLCSAKVGHIGDSFSKHFAFLNEVLDLYMCSVVPFNWLFLQFEKQKSVKLFNRTCNISNSGILVVGITL